jgi:hypothetical protein
MRENSSHPLALRVKLLYIDYDIQRLRKEAEDLENNLSGATEEQ